MFQELRLGDNEFEVSGDESIVEEGVAVGRLLAGGSMSTPEDAELERSCAESLGKVDSCEAQEGSPGEGLPLPHQCQEEAAALREQLRHDIAQLCSTDTGAETGGQCSLSIGDTHCTAPVRGGQPPAADELSSTSAGLTVGHEVAFATSDSDPCQKATETENCCLDDNAGVTDGHCSIAGHACSQPQADLAQGATCHHASGEDLDACSTTTALQPTASTRKDSRRRRKRLGHSVEAAGLDSSPRRRDRLGKRKLKARSRVSVSGDQTGASSKDANLEELPNVAGQASSLLQQVTEHLGEPKQPEGFSGPQKHCEEAKLGENLQGNVLEASAGVGQSPQEDEESDQKEGLNNFTNKNGDGLHNEPSETLRTSCEVTACYEEECLAVRRQLNDDAEALRHQTAAEFCKAERRWAEELTEARGDVERVHAELADEAQRYIEEASTTMEAMTQRLEQEQFQHQEDNEAWRLKEKAYQAECRQWEEGALCKRSEVLEQEGVAAEFRQHAAQARVHADEAHARLEEEMSLRRDEERQRWHALTKWQAVDEAHTQLLRRIEQTEDMHLLQKDAADAARADLEVKLSRLEEQEFAESERHAQKAQKCEEAEAALQDLQRELSTSRESVLSRSTTQQRRQRSWKSLGRCLVPRRNPEDQQLPPELQLRIEDVQQREAELAQRAVDQELATAQLEAAQLRLGAEVEAMETAALQTSMQRLREEQHEEQAAEEHRRQSEMQLEQQRNVAIAQGREQAIHPPGALLNSVPLAVRIPSCDVHKEGLVSRVMLNYSIIVESPGAVESFTKTFAEFRQLHETLSTKPFAGLLQARPQDWFFSHLSTTMLERQRRQLEAYLAFICAHSYVLLDTSIWQWLKVDNLTQVVTRLVVAADVKWIAEVCRLVQVLEAEIAAGGDENRCVHPSLLRVLKDVVLDTHDLEAKAAACRLLDRLLTNSLRARQLFLASEAGGAAALVSAVRSSGDAGDVAAEAAYRILELLAAAEAQGARTRQELAAERQAAAETEEQLQHRQEEARQAADPGECCVCLDRSKSHAMLPCGHLCACMTCAATLANLAQPCPVCRCTIERAVQIFT